MPRRPSRPDARPDQTAAAAAPTLSAARAGLVEAFAAALLANGAATVRLHARVAAHLGLGLGDLTVLDLLARRGPLTAGELGAATGLASASVTGLIDRLEGGKWVRRRRDPADGRRVRVEASTAALRRIGGAFRELGFDVAALVEPCSDAELAQATGLLERVTEQARTAVGASSEVEPAPR